MSWLRKIPWWLLVGACLTLGLAPFDPPHLWEKGELLTRGELVHPLDVFDLLLHGAPWVLLGMKIAAHRGGEE